MAHSNALHIHIMWPKTFHMSYQLSLYDVFYYPDNPPDPPNFDNNNNNGKSAVLMCCLRRNQSIMPTPQMEAKVFYFQAIRNSS